MGSKFRISECPQEETFGIECILPSSETVDNFIADKKSEWYNQIIADKLEEFQFDRNTDDKFIVRYTISKVTKCDEQ